MFLWWSSLPNTNVKGTNTFDTIRSLELDVFWKNMRCPMFGFGNWWQSLWTNGFLELYLKSFSIGFSWSPFVGFKESLWWPRCYSRNYPKSGQREDMIQGWSSCDRHQVCGVQVQVEHHKEIVLEACRPLWWQWTCEDVRKSGSPIVEHGGAIN